METQRKPETLNQAAQKSTRMFKRNFLFTAAFLLILMVLPMLKPQMKVSLTQSSLTLSAPDRSTLSVSCSDIRSISLIQTLSLEKTEEGTQNAENWYGIFSDGAEQFRLFVYPAVPSYIKVTTNRDNIIFNARTLQETESFYQLLKEITNAG